MTDAPIKAAINAATVYDLDFEMEVRCMDDIDMQPVRWLWYQRIALGKLTVIAGDPGLGKSQITAFLAAITSNGKYWPDDTSPSETGTTLIISAEDDAADTIKPRLLAAGADLRKCFVIDAVKSKGQSPDPAIRSFNLREDATRLEQEIIRRGDVKLVIIDPVSAYLGNTDSHNNADMRGVLAPLSAIAGRHNVAVVLVTHQNKSTTNDPMMRIIGSIALIAAARAGYLVQKDKNRPEVRYFIPVKNNIGDDETGFAFQIEGMQVPCVSGVIETSRVAWMPELVKAQDILHPKAEERHTTTNGAQTFLQAFLKEGPRSAKAILAEAAAAGYSEHAVQRAARRLGVLRRKLGMAGAWEWYFPLNDHRQHQVEDGEGCEDGISIKASTFGEATLPSEG